MNLLSTLHGNTEKYRAYLLHWQEGIAPNINYLTGNHLDDLIGTLTKDDDVRFKQLSIMAEVRISFFVLICIGELARLTSCSLIELVLPPPF